MNIGIIPKIKQNRTEVEIQVDRRLILFFNSIFPNSTIKIIFEKNNEPLDFLILSGGNTLINFENTKENRLRNVLDLYYLKKCLKKKIPCLGICHGAQFIASFFDSKIFKKKGHVLKKNHEIITTIDNKILRVNSFHNYCIVKLGMQLESFAKSSDKTIEGFVHKKFSLMGIMWHPERNKTFKNFDKSLIKRFI